METHASPETAHAFFGERLRGVTRYYETGIAVFADKAWADARSVVFHVVVPEVMVALEWHEEGRRRQCLTCRLGG